MRPLLLAAVLSLAALPARADPDHAAMAERALDAAILPGFTALAAETAALAEAAATACAGDGPIDAAPVEAAYQRAFDAWAGVDFLRFGPLEEADTAFAVAFWPDTRGTTPRSIAALVAAEDPVVDDPAGFRTVSVAARGLFALDYLLFDPAAPPVIAGAYTCRLLVAITGDLAATSAGVLARWQDPHAGYLTAPGADNPLYLSPEEVSRDLYSALIEGLRADIDLRLGRPLGEPGNPRPTRAEAWRSGRPLRNVVLSAEALHVYAATVFGPELGPAAATDLDLTFGTALAAAEHVGEPLDAAVATVQGRIRAESLQGALRRVLATAEAEIGATLGLAPGFNSMDGD